MPNEIVFDPAVQYVVKDGTMRIRTDTDEWRTAADEDIATFIKAIKDASPTVGSVEWGSSGNPPDFIENISPTYGTIFLRSNTSSSLSVQFKAESNALKMVIKNGTCSFTYNLGLSGSARAYHWAILSGINKELCILIGCSDETEDQLRGYQSPYGYSPPSSDIRKNNLCKYTTPALFIVHTLDSFTNNTGYSSILIDTFPSPTTAYSSDSEYKEFKYYVNAGGGISKKYYANTPSGSYSGWMPKYYLICGDWMYYVRNSTESMPTSTFSYNAPTYNLAPVYSTVSRCVTVTTLLETWGNMPEPDYDPQDGSESWGIPHLGPELIEMGPSSDLLYYLRAGNIFMPVAKPADPEPEEDEDEDEPETND